MAISLQALTQGVNPVVVPDRTKRFKDIAAAQSERQSQELRGLQIEGERGDLEAQKQAQAKAAAVLDAIEASGGDFEKALPAIRSIDPQFGMSIEKSLLEQQNVRGQITDREADNVLAGRQFDETASNNKLTREAKAAEVAAIAEQNRIERDRIESDRKADNDRQAARDAQIAADAKAARENALTIAQLPARSGGTSETLVPVDDGTGNVTYVPRSQAAGLKVPVSSNNKPSTGVEKRVLTFYIRAKDADENIKSMESAIQNMNLGGQTWMQFAPNFMQSELGGNYRQAQRAFTEARLRKDSGAAIPPNEYENDAKTYFAVPGDTPARLEQKRKARESIMEGLKQESGRAYKEHYGEENTGGGTVEEYERGPDGKLRLKSK